MERNPITGFKVDFDIRNYGDILPMPPENLREVINYDVPSKDCVWKRVVPDNITPQYIEREITRILRTGVWVYIHKQMVWIPPSYYFFLQYFKIGGEYAEFRLSRLKAVYFQIKARNNPYCIGTFVIKSRQIGETSIEMSNILHECADGNTGYGSFGVQSKTNTTVKDSCWRILKGGWQSLPKWLKDTLYSDFASGDNIETKLKFKRSATETQEERDVEIMYGSSGDNTLDSMNNVRILDLDEVLKWRENSFYNTLLNYTKFIAPGRSRKGLFRIFSSPADFPCKSSDEGMIIWKKSDPNQLNKYGVPESRLFRYYASPLEGIQDMFDIYGDADADLIYEFIMEQRAAVDKDKLMGEIRAYPLNDVEIFGSFEGGAMWQNSQGIKDRVVFLAGNRFKNDKTKEPKGIWGNYERVGGYIDGEVEFRPSGKEFFDMVTGRFFVSFHPQNKEELRSIFKPPQYVERCIGFDPYTNRYEAKNKVRQSDAAMVCRQFRDVHDTGVLNVPVATYCCRPQNIEIAYEDAINFAIYNRALIQVERSGDRFASYVEDRGYSDWLLTEIGSTDEKRKGDAPSGGKNAFLSTGIGLIDANTNLPIHPEDPYWLDNHWHSELLEDYLAFNPLDTHDNDLTMADIQSLIGCIKIAYKKIRKPSVLNDRVLSYLSN